jgi:hypothetical protein
MAVGAVLLEGILLVVVGLAVILAVAYLLLRPVFKNYRVPPAPENPPSPESGEAPAGPV